MNGPVSCLLATAFTLSAAAPATAADRFVLDSFNRNTMQGWQRSAGASALAYARVPFHPDRTATSVAQMGFAMTAPYRISGAGVLLHGAAPRLVDLRFNAADVSGGWSSALYLGASPAWSYDPARAPGERVTHMFDSGPSWVAVGLLGAAVIAGTFALTENGT